MNKTLLLISIAAQLTLTAFARDGSTVSTKLETEHLITYEAAVG